MKHGFLMALVALALVGAGADPASAQLEDVTPGGMDAYRNVFIAYAVVWILIGGWVLSISRRLGALSRRMDG